MNRKREFDSNIEHPSQEIRATECATCGAFLRVPLSFLGEEGTCGKCSATIVVTSLRAIDDTIRGQLSDFQRTSSQSGSRSSRGAGRDPSTKHRVTEEQTIGRFRIEKRLGSGGFGDVWRATDTQLGRQVAIKLPRFSPRDKKRRARFVKEARAVAALRHPNIVPVLDVGESDSGLMMVSEYVKGRPLSEVHGKRPAPPIWAAEVVAELAEAVAYAHESGIIHRDLKPDNVLLDSDDRPQLLDFGLAKRLDSDEENDSAKTIDGTVLGTPAYMAPEQAAGRIADISEKSDQYSLGVILYRLICGRTPFKGAPLAIITQLCNEKAPPPSEFTQGIPPDLQAICMKCLQRDHRDRYASCDELVADLHRFQMGEPVHVRPISPLTKLARWSGKHRLEASLMASFALLLIAMSAVTSAGAFRANRASQQAARTEASLRIKTAELLALRDKMGRQLEVAQEGKAELEKTKERLIASRQALDAEQKRLADAKANAETALKELEEKTQSLADINSSKTKTQAKVADVKESLATAETMRPSPLDSELAKLQGMTPELLTAIARNNIPVIENPQLPSKSELAVGSAEIECFFNGEWRIMREAPFAELVKVGLLTKRSFNQPVSFNAEKMGVLEAFTQSGGGMKKWRNGKIVDRLESSRLKRISLGLGLEPDSRWRLSSKVAGIPQGMSRGILAAVCENPPAIVSISLQGSGDANLEAIIAGSAPTGISMNPSDRTSQFFLIRSKSIQLVKSDFSSATTFAHFTDSIRDAVPLTSALWIFHWSSTHDKSVVLMDFDREEYMAFPPSLQLHYLQFGRGQSPSYASTVLVNVPYGYGINNQPTPAGSPGIYAYGIRYLAQP